MDSADQIFEAELKRRGIAATKTNEGLYRLTIADRTLTVSLENVRRNFERDHKSDAIIQFVDQLGTDFFDEIPSWGAARAFIRYSLEATDYQEGLEESLRDRVTDELCKLYVLISKDGSHITWVNESFLKDWGKEKAEVIRQADENMNEIIAQTKVEITEVRGVKLGMLSTSETPFKASLILSSKFRELVEPSHGWPVLVVVPSRDSVYVLAKSDQSFLGHIGRVVVEEFKKSGHHVTKDVLEVSENGIKAIGTFPD